MNKKLLSAFAAGATLLSIGTMTSFAATTQDITVKHSAYLRTTPHTSSYKITLEHAGSTLTLEPGSTQYWWHVQDENGNSGYITRSTYYTEPTNTNTTNATATTSGTTSATPTTSRTTTSQPVQVSSGTTTQLPPGVTYDSNVNPIATPNATSQQKFDAILEVAQAQLGTPYVWGTSKDRGQDSFDCSNYTAYVYHHALGYKMSGASQTQYHSVGWTVPTSNMQPGDLLVFNQGGHVGIYIGNGQMIQCGGGLAKVGYLKVSPGSYWYNHITVVKRMF